MFSKYMFKENRYDQMNVTEEEKKYIKTYCLAMALESKRFTAVQLKAMRDQINWIEYFLFLSSFFYFLTFERNRNDKLMAKPGK